jgi:hypothetical protein
MNNIEQNDAIRQSNTMRSVTKKHGVCFHMALQQMQCFVCGKNFANHEEWQESINELRAEWL